MEQLRVNSEEISPAVDVRERVRSLIEGRELSQAQAAREAGLSPSALSRWLKDTYPGDNAAVAEKLQRYLDSRDRQAGFLMPEAPGWQSTHTAERVMTALSYGQMAADLVVIYGGAGLGKTETARHYAKTRPNVWVATMSPASSTVSAALEELYLALGISDSTQGTAAVRLQRTLIHKLRDTRGLLIVDEAQHLGVQGLEAMRAIHDAAGIGLALIGNETVYSRLTGGSRAAHFAQLYSRIGKRVSLSRPTAKDTETLAAAWGISEQDAVAYLGQIAAKPGALRGVVKTLQLATMLATGAGETLGLNHLRAAWRDLGGEV